jgi:hypothetical protein
VFHRDFLLALPAVAIERVEQHCEGASELAGLVQMLTPQGRRCIAIHGVFVAAHCGVVAGEHLRRNHLFEPVFWLDCGYTSIKNFSAGLVEVLDRLTGDSTRGLSADVSFPPNARFSVAASQSGANWSLQFFPVFPCYRCKNRGISFFWSDFSSLLFHFLSSFPMVIGCRDSDYFSAKQGYFSEISGNFSLITGDNSERLWKQQLRSSQPFSANQAFGHSSARAVPSTSILGVHFGSFSFLWRETYIT